MSPLLQPLFRPGRVHHLGAHNLKPSRWTLPPRRLLFALTVLASLPAARGQNLFVSNLATGSVWEFDPHGNLVTSAFAPGLNQPQGIAFDKGGNLYVVYGGNSGTVAKYGPGGNLINPTFISGLSACSGIAFDSNGNLYLANTSAGRIAKYGPNGNLLNAAFASGNLSGTWSMVLDANDNLYLAGGYNNNVTKVSPTGTVNSSFITGLSYPTGVALDASGNLYLANNVSGLIAEYDTNGHLLNPTFAVGGSYNLESLAFDSQGNLFAGNNGNGTIAEYAADGTLLNADFASGGSGAEYIAFSVPEPSGLVLAGLGALLAGARAVSARSSNLRHRGPKSLGPASGN